MFRRRCIGLLGSLGVISYVVIWMYFCPEERIPEKRCCSVKGQCWPCSQASDISEYCALNPGQYDCEVYNACCRDSNKYCLACQNNVTVKDFCKDHPGIYGCKGDIMIAVYLFNKMGYVKFTSSVIRDFHRISQADLYLFDDASDQYNKTKLHQWYGKDAHVFRSNLTMGFATIFREMISRFLASQYTIMYLLDAETVFLPNWRNFTSTHIHKVKGGFISLYHSSVNHSFKMDCQKVVNSQLCTGDVLNRFGIAMNRQLAGKLNKKKTATFTNLNWTRILHDEGIEPLYPMKSLAMQIGQKNQGPDDCGENEVAYRFNRCLFPEWIQKGIEFYFDRCTSPNTFYFHTISMLNLEKEGRFWTRPVISYSLYGSQRRYTQIAIENAARVFSIYPGWKIWIYTDGSVPKPVMQELCEFDIRFIDVSKTKIRSKMSWRFLVASEPVKMYAIRDIDSYLLPRGKAAVDEWIKSGRKFHVMRDHPNHSRYPMSGGMWGGTHDAIPNMRQLVEYRQGWNRYMEDMGFLNHVIWKIASQSVWTHDSYSLHKFGEDHPFPTERDSKNSFVGDVII